MAKQTINIGSLPNDKTGDPIRTAFIKVNENFTEIYNIAQSTNDYANTILQTTNSSFNVANTGVLIAEGAFQQANTGVLIAEGAFQQANTGVLIAEASFEQANSVIYPHIELTKRHEPSGNIITFTRPADTDVSDEIDVGLSLARSNNGQGLYNSAVEVSYNADVSPANTEWNWSGWDNLDNVKFRHYRTWREALRKKVGSNIVGAELVMHDLTNDKYYKIKFTDWNIGGVGGANGSFAYTRELIDTSTQVGIVFEDGTNQITASNPKDWPIVWLDNNNYTLRLIDANRTLRGYDMTIFVPRDSDVNFPVGTNIEIVSESIGVRVERVQHIEEIEAQIYGSGFGETRAFWEVPAHSFARLIKVDTNLWYIVIAGQAAFDAANTNSLVGANSTLSVSDISGDLEFNYNNGGVVATVRSSSLILGNELQPFSTIAHTDGVGLEINTLNNDTISFSIVKDEGPVLLFWKFNADGTLTFEDLANETSTRFIKVDELKSLVANSATYGDFQTAIANL